MNRLERQIRSDVRKATLVTIPFAALKLAILVAAVCCVAWYPRETAAAAGRLVGNVVTGFQAGYGGVK